MFTEPWPTFSHCGATENVRTENAAQNCRVENARKCVKVLCKNKIDPSDIGLYVLTWSEKKSGHILIQNNNELRGYVITEQLRRP